jgi:hypothetical protein
MVRRAAVAGTASAIRGPLESAAESDPEFGMARFPIVVSDALNSATTDQLAVSLCRRRAGCAAPDEAVPAGAVHGSLGGLVVERSRLGAGGP